jgi:NitT/TauT family transport system substrate-binding protein
MVRWVVAAALIGALAFPHGARAEATTLRVAKQFGVAYMQFMVMEDQKLIEKQAKAAGLGDIAVEFNQFRSSDVMNDALLSGSVDFVSLGIPGIITIWSKTKGNLDVKAASSLNVSPLMLLVRDPAIKSIRDFKDHHKIALPAVKVAMQAIMLQMAAAKEFGEAKFNALDHLTVSMAHPDATAAMLGGPSEIVANFSSAPFQYRQMKNPNIRRILSSSDLFTDGLSFNVIATTSKFRRDNPKLYGAFRAALKEATDFINADKRRAAEIYLKVSKDRTSIEEIMEVLADPAIQYTLKPGGIESFVSFMAKVGTLKNPPADWREMFFPRRSPGRAGEAAPSSRRKPGPIRRVPGYVVRRMCSSAPSSKRIMGLGFRRDECVRESDLSAW